MPHAKCYLNLFCNLFKCTYNLSYPAQYVKLYLVMQPAGFFFSQVHVIIRYLTNYEVLFMFFKWIFVWIKTYSVSTFVLNYSTFQASTYNMMISPYFTFLIQSNLLVKNKRVFNYYNHYNLLASPFTLTVSCSEALLILPHAYYQQRSCACIFSTAHIATANTFVFNNALIN